MRLIVLPALLFITSFPVYAGAQRTANPAHQSLAGVWSGRADGNARRQGDAFVFTDRRPITLTLTSMGDSLTGVWTFDGVELAVRGILRDNTLTLMSESRAVTETRNGQRVVYQVHTELSARVEGNELRGTATVRRNSERGPLRRWEAKRR